MVNFKKKLKSKRQSKVIDPCKLYQTLDRASDKGPLRPAQEHILSVWYENHRNDSDLIVKLHTGQGKTLIGLLMQYSLLNENISPAVYLCPNIFLVNQTIEQARQFGIAVTTPNPELPVDYLDGKKILVTTVHKLFNGLTKFGLGTDSSDVGSIVIDDCHACIDSIKEACSIQLSKEDKPFLEILNLFESDLKYQGSGRFADIKGGDGNSFLPIPYWAWASHSDEVTNILAKYKNIDSIKFSWPLLRDSIQYCQCVVSGVGMQIVPYEPPLSKFGSFKNAQRRIYMSATVTDDSFLVRGLELSSDVIKKPLTYPKEKWCGEKMILMPSLLSQELTRNKIIRSLCTVKKKFKFGRVGLVPSFAIADLWEKSNAIVANKETIDGCVEKLRSGVRDHALCIVNRYDGVDLPDEACRILIIDSKPKGASLSEKYSEDCRPDSKAVLQRVVRTIEQGLGRSVRGEKDYCAIVLIGPDLVSAIMNKNGRSFFSAQTKRQIEIGLEIASYASDDLTEGAVPLEVFVGLIKQIINRDEGWKEYYSEQMEAVPEERIDSEMLGLYEIEARAAKKAEDRQFEAAVEILQQLIDQNDLSDSEKGWYLQEMARYLNYVNKVKSRRLQVSAFSLNRNLLLPEQGVQFKKLLPHDQKASVSMCDWIKDFGSHEELMIYIESILTDLRFGAEAESFENSMQLLGKCLGFPSERPDKEWKEGPDNLWCISPTKYVLIECKNQVEISRKEIHRTETGQFNNSIGWFKQHYGDHMELRCYLVIPAEKLSRGASISELEKTRIINKRGLSKLCSNIRAFFSGLIDYELNSLDSDKLGELLQYHGLNDEKVFEDCSVPIKKAKKK